MSEYNSLADTSCRRSLRAHRKAMTKYSYTVAYCHHCTKTLPVCDLVQCSSKGCGLHFCILCLQKYKPTLKKKHFVRMRDSESYPCFVCRDRCLCEKCQAKAFDQDFDKIEKLAVESKDTESTPTKGKIGVLKFACLRLH